MPSLFYNELLCILFFSFVLSSLVQTRLPLNYASYGGRLDTAKYLVVEEGVSTDIKDKRSQISEQLAGYLHEFEGKRQRHGGVVSFLEAYSPTVT